MMIEYACMISRCLTVIIDLHFLAVLRIRLDINKTVELKWMIMMMHGGAECTQLQRSALRMRVTS